MALKTGWEDAGNGLVRNTATGQMVDQNHPTYLNDQQGPNGVAAPTVGSPQSSYSTNAGQIPGTPTTVGQTTAQGAPTTVAQSFQQALVNRLNPTPVSAASPEVAPAIEANKLAEQRALERNRGLLAERAARYGYDSSGSFDTGLLGLAQDRAAREGQFAGNAVQRANDIQNQNATSALGIINSLLSGNANRDLQSELGHGDLDLRRLGIEQQGRLGEGQLNLGLLNALLNNDQFGRSLGQQGAQFGASLDQSGLLGLLGLL